MHLSNKVVNRLDLKPAGQTGAGKSYSMVGYGANKVGTCWDQDQNPRCTGTEARTCSTEFCDWGLLLTLTMWLHRAGHRAHLVRRDFQENRRLPPRIHQLLEPSLLKPGTSSRTLDSAGAGSILRTSSLQLQGKHVPRCWVVSNRMAKTEDVGLWILSSATAPGLRSCGGKVSWRAGF